MQLEGQNHLSLNGRRCFSKLAHLSFFNSESQGQLTIKPQRMKTATQFGVSVDTKKDRHKKIILACYYLLVFSPLVTSLFHW